MVASEIEYDKLIQASFKEIKTPTQLVNNY